MRIYMADNTYKFDVEQDVLTKVLDDLSVRPTTHKMTVNLTTPGVYVFVDNKENEISGEYCPGYSHEYDSDDDTVCNNCKIFIDRNSQIPLACSRSRNYKTHKRH